MSTCRPSYFGLASSHPIFKFPQRWLTDVLSVSHFLHWSAAPVLHPCPLVVNPWSRLTGPISGGSHSGYFLPCRLPLSVTNCFSFAQGHVWCLNGIVSWFHSSTWDIELQRVSLRRSAEQQERICFQLFFDDYDRRKRVFAVELFQWNRKFSWHEGKLLREVCKALAGSKWLSCWQILKMDWMDERR